MSEHRYTDAEVHAIFERAAVRQEEARRAEDASRAGLSLAELQRIGAEAGIDPAHVAVAAAELAHRRTPEAPEHATFLGMPTALRAERLISNAVPDEAWERIVPELRRIFGTDGIAGEVGRVREWTMGQRQGRHDRAVKVTLTPEGGGTRIVIEQTMRGSALGLTIGSGLYVLVAAVIAGLSLLGTPGEPPAAVALVFAVMAVVMFGGTQLGMRLYGRKQEARFEQALDRIELIARDAEAGEEPALPDARPALDPESSLGQALDALEDAPEAARSRKRMRS